MPKNDFEDTRSVLDIGLLVLKELKTRIGGGNSPKELKGCLSSYYSLLRRYRKAISKKDAVSIRGLAQPIRDTYDQLRGWVNFNNADPFSITLDMLLDLDLAAKETVPGIKESDLPGHIYELRLREALTTKERPYAPIEGKHDVQMYA